MAMQIHAKTQQLFRFSLKKEWLKLTCWLIGVLFSIGVGLFAFVEVYGEAAEREAMVAAMSNPAMEALFGRIIGADNYTIGAMYSHTMTIMMLCLIAVMSILLVVRNTRAEEEDGILEMLRALPVGRVAHTSSAILLLFVTNALVAIFTTLLILPFEESSLTVEGAILTGAMYGTVGLVFGAITLVTAQLSSNARGAMMGAFGVLGLSYMLRTIGDAGQEALSWISPLGLLYGTEPFVENYWWPIFVALAITFVLIGVALYLGERRDIGAGLLPDKAGKQHASGFLKTTLGFILRLIKTPLIVWLIAVAMLGVSYGSVIGDVESMLEGNDVIAQMLASESDINIVAQFMSMIIGVLAIAAAIPSLQVFLRLKGEEKKNRTEQLLSGSRSRLNFIGTFLGVSLFTSVLMQAVQMSAFAGSAVAMDFDVQFGEIFSAGMAYLPALWIMIGLAVFLYGWLPKLTGLVWAGLGFAFVVHYFAELFDMPEWLMGISPYYHIPAMPVDEWSWGIFLTLTAVAVVLSIVGLIGYKRRDITG